MRPRSTGGLGLIAKTSEKNAIDNSQKFGLLSAATIVHIVVLLVKRGIAARSTGFISYSQIINLGKDTFPPVKQASHPTAN
jgi:hypothetical protein